MWSEIKWRIQNRSMLDIAQRIAIATLKVMDKEGWSKTDLAKRMHIDPRGVDRILKGKTNLKISTLVKLEKALGISIFNKDLLKTVSDINVGHKKLKEL